MKKATTKLSAVLAVLAAGAVAAPAANADSAPASEVVSGQGYGVSSAPVPHSGLASEVVSGHGYGLLGVPAASSSPVSEVVSGHGYGFPDAPSNVVPTASTSSGGGFDWGDAGIGAAAAAVSLLGLAGGAILVVRRGRRHETAIS
jgi:hypothetical protein